MTTIQSNSFSLVIPRSASDEESAVAANIPLVIPRSVATRNLQFAEELQFPRCARDDNNPVKLFLPCHSEERKRREICCRREQSLLPRLHRLQIACQVIHSLLGEGLAIDIIQRRKQRQP